MTQSEQLQMRIYLPGGEVVESSYVTSEADYRHMDGALEQAEIAGQEGDNAIGCVYVLPNGETVATQTREFRDQDLEAHAEKMGYRKIKPQVGRSLHGCKLYTIAEPCYGCAYTLDKGNLGILFVAAAKADAPDFFRNGDTLDHIWRKTRRQLTVVSGLRKVHALEILGRYGKKH